MSVSILPIIVMVWRAVEHLVAPPGDGSDDVTTGRVPLHVRGHVVLSYVHHSAVWCVNEGKSSIHAAQNRTETIKHVQKHIHKPEVTGTLFDCGSQGYCHIHTQRFNWPSESGQHQELSLRAPEDAVGLLFVKHLCRKRQKLTLKVFLWGTSALSMLFVNILEKKIFLLTYELDLSIIFDMIEGGADSGRLSVENSKLAAVGFPCKRYDAFWNESNNRSESCLSPGISLCLFYFSSYPSSPPHQQEPASPSCGRFQSWWPHPKTD